MNTLDRICNPYLKLMQRKGVPTKNLITLNESESNGTGCSAIQYVEALQSVRRDEECESTLNESESKSDAKHV